MNMIDWWRIENDKGYYDDIPEEYQDDSDRSCKDCPDDECTGHCMSCYYRTV